MKHIVVCVCTYRRPNLLNRLLNALREQGTGGLFTYSIVIVDNDASESAKSVVAEFQQQSTIRVTYCVEHRRGIAYARNKAVRRVSGDFIAFVDDDEFPTSDWLVNLFEARNKYGVDGVLGPVKRHFDETPPAWLVKGEFFQRPSYPTGLVLDWTETRTGNVLLKADLFVGEEEPFRSKFRSGEDQDFFRRMIDAGRVFVWCDEAIVHEVVPPARWKRKHLLRKALLSGSMYAVHDIVKAGEVLKSATAVPVYAICLPVALILGQHTFMGLLVRLCHHVGKLLALVGINPITDPYITD